MGAESKIQWTDATFQPWWGCTKVSPGCEHCYNDRPRVDTHPTQTKFRWEAQA